MTENICYVQLDFLENFMVDVFSGLGVPAEDAKICANVLIAADKKGIDSHGVARLKSVYYDRIKAKIQFPDSNLEILKEAPTTAVVDCHNGMGRALSKKSMDIAISKGRKIRALITVKVLILC